MEHLNWITPYPTRADCKRRYQFTLCGLFILTTVVAAFVAVAVRWGVPGVLLLLFSGACLQIWRGIVKRRADLAVFGIVAILALFGCSIPLCSVVVWDGHTTVPLQFVVVDSANGKPISGAAVRLRRTTIDTLPNITVPAGEPGAQASTSEDGTVSLGGDFDTSGRESWLENYDFVYFERSYDGDYWVQVTAPGYTSYLARLISLTGLKRDIQDKIPPPLRIALDPVVVQSNHLPRDK
jgi:hypothetical protein